MPESRYAAEVDSRHNSSTSGFVMVAISLSMCFTRTLRVKVPMTENTIHTIILVTTISTL